MELIFTLVLLTCNAVDAWSQNPPPLLARPMDTTTSDLSKPSVYVSLEDSKLFNSDKLIDINTLMMRKMVDYGAYYVCMIERKLKPSDFGFSDTAYRDRIYQITVVGFTDWEYLLRDASGEPIQPKNSFDLRDVAIPQMMVVGCIFPGTETTTAAFNDAVKGFTPYRDLGSPHSDTNKTGILVTSKTGFETSGRNILLLKPGNAQKVQNTDGFTKTAPVYLEQELDPRKENAIVQIWRRLDDAIKKLNKK